MNRSYKIFTDTVLNWFDKHGRKHFPWQNPACAYRVWLSEIMLQQTQVKTVIPYFNRFVERFPTIQSLAHAPEDEVLAHWSGLGYYSRARNLHKTAKLINQQFQNQFPSDLSQLESLPGIGPSTAAAIASLAFNQPTAILDGNVKRVLCRYFLIDGLTETAAVKSILWKLANACMPKKRCAHYTQAIMDMGATCCTIRNPNCLNCPLNSTCAAYLTQQIDNYPNKKPKIPIPNKFQQFILLYNADNAIYLEKRPPTGIWGGLWCLPNIEMEDDAQNHIKNRYNIHTEQIQEMMSLKHVFTHFRLHIKVISLKAQLADAVAEHPGRWFAMNEITQVGIAKPVKLIADHFYANLS